VLSYRHAYHAGNHADVLKHAALVLMLEYLIRKEAPLCYIDTHSGVGRYRFDTQEALKNREFDTGVTRLRAQAELPELLRPYDACIRAINGGDALQCYPGSPGFAAQLLREQDRLRLFELHPQDHAALARLFAGDRRVRVEKQDGLAGLKALLPPPSRRALVLIDPPYERQEEYRLVVDTLKDALRRFAIGTYVVWYPLLENAAAKRLPMQLEALKCQSSLRAELRVQAPAGEFGLYGSGLFVINPPWQLAQQLRELLPYLAHTLGVDDGAGWRLDVVGD
jgi:23S rRNA (adenine2030-N6)-methyltransferase